MIEDDAHAEPLVVSDRARRAAADLLDGELGGTVDDAYLRQLHQGERDWHPYVQAFARFERDLRPALPDMAALVERLRAFRLVNFNTGEKEPYPLAIEAADAVTKLSADYARLREALQIVRGCTTCVACLGDIDGALMEPTDAK